MISSAEVIIGLDDLVFIWGTNTFVPHCIVMMWFCTGAWAYYAARMNISSSDTEIQTEGFRVNGEWEVFNTQVNNNIIILPCCPDIQ